MENPDRDPGGKLAMAIFLYLRRQKPALYYPSNGGEMDLCNEDGTAFWNVCCLTDPDTVQREQRAMALGKSGARKARSALLYHEFDAAVKPALPEAQPAWDIHDGESGWGGRARGPGRPANEGEDQLKQAAAGLG